MRQAKRRLISLVEGGQRSCQRPRRTFNTKSNTQSQHYWQQTSLTCKTMEMTEKNIVTQ